ncbi:dynein regulatory complex protein 11-like [Pimephales promelas]|uniref:dynein regulatory complex protein 11-like n=1 Tax=Pimephales promelas TaxID=90988 RepID=UPI0019555DB2|nr:dynein regulatory complex protein 11-like [Pimephales promelas]
MWRVRAQHGVQSDAAFSPRLQHLCFRYASHAGVLHKPTSSVDLLCVADVWHCRDEKQNFIQSFDAQLVREEKRLEVEEELRVQVDELMRQELKNLKLVVDRDKGKKKKKVKKSSKKKKKKGRKTGKKKKKEKDLTADRTIESLYEELVREGFIIRPMNVKLSDYIGKNYTPLR